MATAENPSMHETTIEAEALTKYFHDYPAISGVSFRAKKGEVIGLLGPNGAGKTTTIRILTGAIAPTSGFARIGGWDVAAQPMQARRRLGYLPENAPLYTDMTLSDYLLHVGRMRGMPGQMLRERLAQVIDDYGLSPYAGATIAKLSKGYRQRVALAQAVLHEPDVLILDEPTLGIDPVQLVETRELIRHHTQMQTVLLSTHILAEAAILCDRVLVMHGGRLVAEESPARLSAALRSRGVELTVAGPHERVTGALAAVPGVANVTWKPGTEADYYSIEPQNEVDISAGVVRAIINHGWRLVSMNEAAPNLEEAFIRLIANGADVKARDEG